MTYENHTPNVVSAKKRIALFATAILLLVFIFAEVATGYTFIPGKGGGILLSGLATLFVVISASGLLFASVLMIIDHYDKRPNEKSYAILREQWIKTSLCLLFAAPFVHLLQMLLQLYGIDITKYIHGLAEGYTFFNPKYYQYVEYVKPITSNGGAIVFFIIATAGVTNLINKFSSVPTRITAFIAGIAILAFSILILASATEDFFNGYVRVGTRAYIALKEPAKFNAVLLSLFTFGGTFFILSVFSIINSITDNLKS